MATFYQRQRKDGSVAHMAIIRIKRHGQLIHRECQTFSRLALAREWARRREVELETPLVLQKAQAHGMTVKRLTEKYIADFETISKWQRSKQAGLKQLANGPLGSKDAVTLTSGELVEHIRQRRAGGASGPTAMNDLVWLGVVLRAAKAVWHYPIDPAVVDEARIACRALRLVAKSRPRDRLPTYEELERLDAQFARTDRRADIPMRHIMWFAIYSSRRQEEITRLLRSDDDDDRHMGMVRDAKHPTAKDGNHRKFRYTPAAWAILQMQPKGPIAFPYDAKSISGRFTRTCKILGIEDLHFHDLRHEATTRLFEAGLSIPEVTTYTLHDSWAVLKRYNHASTRRRIFNAPFLSSEALQKPTGF